MKGVRLVSSWIVSNVPSWILLLALIVLVAGGALLTQTYVRHQFPRLKRDEHNDVTRFAFGIIGFVYAFFTGFIVNAMWAQTNSADTSARIEAAAAVQLAKDLHAFDQGDSDRIRQRLLEYERAVEVEWPLASRSEYFPEADNALRRLYTAYQEVQPRTDIQKTFLVTSLNNLDKVSQKRTERVLLARTDTGPPWSLWAVIFLTSGMVLGGAILYGGDKPGRHYAMVATVGVLIASNLFLILQLSHPYLGEIATSTQPMREVIRALLPPPS
jgi:hypothetical protein